jgi:molybdate transport system ATP-binding protein
MRQPGRVSGAPLVTLDAVDVHLWGADILRGVSLRILPGESWALVGGNGAGKSTLLRVIRGDEQPTPATRGRRLYRLGGPASPSPIGARERIALVSPEQQEAYLRRDWDMRAESAVRTGFGGEVWLAADLPPARERRVDEVCALLGIERLRHRSVLSLSTGELRRVLLARALVSRPRLLLLDEPCDGLDAGARRAFLRTLSRLAHLGPPLVLATHRYDEILPAIARVALLEGGRIVDQGTRREVLRRILPPVATATRTPTATRTATRTSTAKGSRGLPRRAEAILRIESADVRLDGREVLHGVDWTVRRGEHWAVLGHNGAGKSTLLRLAVGDEQAMPGGVVARLGLGERASVWEVKARVGLVTPELQARFRADILAEEVVLSGFTSSTGIDFDPTPAQRRRAAAAMRQTGAARLAGRRIHSLSYGEMRRLLLARALVRRPEVLVLDEPMNGLDPHGRAWLGQALSRLAHRGATLILSTHHRGELPAAVTHELELREGRVAYRGRRR